MLRIKISIIAMACVFNFAHGMQDIVECVHFQPSITAAALSLDGRIMVAGSLDGQVYLTRLAWGVPHGQPRYYRYNDGRNLMVTSLCVDDDVVAAGYENGRILVFDGNLAKQREFSMDRPDEIRKIMVSGSYVAVLTVNSHIKVWDMYSEDCLQDLEAKSPIEDVVLDSSINSIFVAMGSEVIELDIQSRGRIKSVCRMFKPITAFCITAQGMWVCTNEGNIILRDMYTGRNLRTIITGERLESLHVSSDDRALLGKNVGGRVLAWDCTTGLLIDAMDFSSDTYGHMVFGGNMVGYCNVDGPATLYKIANHALRIKFFNASDQRVNNFCIYEVNSGNPCMLSMLFDIGVAQSVDLVLRDVFRGCRIILTTNGGQFEFRPRVRLSTIRQIELVNDLANGSLLLQVSFVGSDGKDSCEYVRPVGGGAVHASADEQKSMDLLVYGPYEQPRSVTLTDANGNAVQASQDRLLPSLWNIEGVRRLAPYRLTLETEKNAYVWSIPFLSEQTELFIFKTKGAIPQLQLFAEAAAQGRKVPLTYVQNR